MDICQLNDEGMVNLCVIMVEGVRNCLGIVYLRGFDISDDHPSEAIVHELQFVQNRFFSNNTRISYCFYKLVKI
jgi:hypothetical protein